MRAVRCLVSIVVALAAVALATPQAAASRETVNFKGYMPGTVVVKTSERRLYYVMMDGKAVRYRVGVGKAGKAWTGSAFITGKFRNPSWSPPADVKRDNPRLPDVIAGGSPSNPMGVAALTLSGGGQYAIHGTNVPNSVGGFVSYGCIRMLNRDVADLFERVYVGTPVVVER